MSRIIGSVRVWAHGVAGVRYLMKHLDTIAVNHQGQERRISLYIGDLARLPQHEGVDLLVVSAFPGDYTPTPSSLIGALARAGVSVSDCAADKEVDLRRFSSCWLSRPVAKDSVHFQRLLCFEPSSRGKAPELVGDIFRSIVPFTTGKPPISTLAMPPVASGDQGESPAVMLEALTEASVHWLSIGLPLDHIKIVLHEVDSVRTLSEVFAVVKRRHVAAAPARQPSFRFDAFISYSHQNKEAVDFLAAKLQTHRPGLRVFLDRMELRPGAAWQQHIFESLDASRKIICVYSPDYLDSKVCKEEFNMALFRHRETTDGVLLPLYLHTAELPTYMKLIQYEDARENDREKIATSAERLLGAI